MPKEFFVQNETGKVFAEVPEDAEGDFTLINKPEHLIDAFDKDKLVEILTGIRGKAVDSDAKKSAKKLAFEAFKMATDTPPKKTLPGESDKPKTPRAESKLAKLRAKLIPGTTVTKQELSEASGYDLPNTHTAMSILKNPARTKEPFFYIYNKADQSYSIFASKEEMEAATPTAPAADGK